MDQIAPERMGDLATMEGVAESLLDEIGLDEPPVDAFEVAVMCGLRVLRSPSRGGCLGADGIIRLDSKARPERQHGVLSHELGHFALRRAGELDTEEAASFVGSAILLPRRHFDRDLRRTWDLEVLRAKHLHVSAEMIAKRIVSMRDAIATILDEGRVKDRVCSPWLDARYRRLTRWERDLAAEALESGRVVAGDTHCYALPLIDPPWRRVVLVCEAEQLSLRLEAR